MKNNPKNTACGPSHFNVIRTAKKNSVTLVQKNFDLLKSIEKPVFHKVSFFKHFLRQPSSNKEETRQLSRCRPEGNKIRMIVLAMLISPLLAFLPVHTGALVGLVFSDDHRPVSNVMIVIENSKYCTSTNSEGFFVIDPLVEGEYTAFVIGASLTEQRYPVVIRKDRSTVLEIEADSFSFNDH